MKEPNSPLRNVSLETPAGCRRSQFTLDSLARGVALFLGGFSLLNVVGEFRRPHFDANLWWIDLRLLPYWLAVSLLVFGSICLLAFGFCAPKSRWWRTLGVTAAGLSGMACAGNTVWFYVLMVRGEISPHV